MAQKGQISLDLLLTLVVVIVVTTSMTAFLTNLKENQEIMVLENELKLQAAKTSAVITSSKAIEDTNFTAKILLDELDYRGEKFYPTVVIVTDQNKIILSENKTGNNLSAESYYSKPKKGTVTVANNALVIYDE